MKKEKMLRGRWDTLLGSACPAHFQKGNRVQKQHVQEGFQGWTIKASTPFKRDLSGCPKDLRIFSFFIATAIRVCRQGKEERARKRGRGIFKSCFLRIGDYLGMYQETFFG
ncbi:hypothetical protein EDM54_20815 [Brevibacillus borstelensis]|nr:hypothetical protein EDM54_20815 [Brevibacillus borstelensis]